MKTSLQSVFMLNFDGLTSRWTRKVFVHVACFLRHIGGNKWNEFTGSLNRWFGEKILHRFGNSANNELWEQKNIGSCWNFFNHHLITTRLIKWVMRRNLSHWNIRTVAAFVPFWFISWNIFRLAIEIILNVWVSTCNAPGDPRSSLT